MLHKKNQSTVSCMFRMSVPESRNMRKEAVLSPGGTAVYTTQYFAGCQQGEQAVRKCC